MISRRKFITFFGAAGACLAMPLPAFTRTLSPSRRFTWEGYAMGTNISLQLVCEDKAQSESIVQQGLEELERLENIFSLYRDDSALVRLNEVGHLENPPFELVELMALAQHYGSLTGGIFNMALQPVWELLKREGPDSPHIKEALKLADGRKIQISPIEISFDQTGMAVSLNGIAQGYITDKITALIAAQGIKGALIDMGEVRSFGSREDGSVWQVGIQDPRDQELFIRKVPLVSRALSTTGEYTATGKHIFNPQSGAFDTPRYLSLSVAADTATKADALSTAFYLMPVDRIREMLYRIPDVGVLIVHTDGTTQELGNF